MASKVRRPYKPLSKETNLSLGPPSPSSTDPHGIRGNSTSASSHTLDQADCPVKRDEPFTRTTVSLPERRSFRGTAECPGSRRDDEKAEETRDLGWQQDR